MLTAPQSNARGRSAGRRRGLAILGIPVVVLAMGFLYLQWTPFAIAGVQAQPTTQCEPGTVPLDPSLATSAVGLSLRLNVEVNCAVSALTFDVQRVGGLLLVKSSHPPLQVATGCNCTRGYVLDLPGVPSREYTVVQYPGLYRPGETSEVR